MSAETPEQAAEVTKRCELLQRQIDAVHSITSAFTSKIDLDALLRETLRVSRGYREALALISA